MTDGISDWTQMAVVEVFSFAMMTAADTTAGSGRRIGRHEKAQLEMGDSV